MTETVWWRGAVFYEIYLRSFADGNGDGVGDLVGARRRLPYLAQLGVDAVWLTPFYRSPMADGGYDVENHCDVDPVFGSLEDFDALLAEAHRLSIRVTVDIVPNHVSDQHRWFMTAVAAGPGSPERDRFIFRDDAGDGSPPNNWGSDFGGPAWTRLTRPDGQLEQWYLHLFGPEQPDLNWEHPDVRAEFEAILRFWLDRGVDGFRIDVAHGLVKAAGMPDNAVLPPTRSGTSYRPVGHQWDQPGVHSIYRDWRLLLDSYPGDRMAIGEAWVETHEALARYVRPDELHQAFNFHLLQAPWEAAALRGAIVDSLAAASAVGAAATWVLSNHDVVRHVTRYGGGTAGQRRARAAALLMLALPGAAYLYQGEELGLPEVDVPDEARRDPMLQRSSGAHRGRDGARVPLPWEARAPGLGFCPPEVAPWLPWPEDWHELAVDRQHGQTDSVLSLYAEALRHRRSQVRSQPQHVEWLDAPPEALLFRRGTMACGVNLGDAPLSAPAEGRLLVRSSPGPATVLERDAAAWWLVPAQA